MTTRVVFPKTGLFVGIAAVAAVLMAVNWFLGPSTPKPLTPTSAQTASRTSSEVCDNIYRTYQLSNQTQPLPGKRGCKMGWNVVGGGIYLTDRAGTSYGPYYKDSIVTGTPTVIGWRAANGNAVVSARFY